MLFLHQFTLSFITTQEYQLLDIVDEVGDALILILKLRQFLFQMCHRSLIFSLFLVVDARTASPTRLQLSELSLVSLLAAMLEL